MAALEATHPTVRKLDGHCAEAGTLIISAHQAIDDILRWTRAGRAALPEVTADALPAAAC